MRIVFFADHRGFEPVREWLEDIETSNPSLFNRAIYLLNMLSDNGQLIRSGVMKVKDIKMLKDTGGIWQVRMHDDRVLLFFFADDIILLNQFQKKQNSTPISEIAKAQKYMKEYIEEAKK